MSGPDRNGGPSARIFPSSDSIATSVSSRSFRPPASKNLMPLSGYGLWLAEIMAPGARSATHAPARPGRGQPPGARGGPPLRADRADERGLEHRPRPARIARDQVRDVGTER